MKKIVALWAFHIMLFGAFAQVQVFPAGHFPARGVKGASITYALPATTLKMTVSVSRVQEVRGYFADYAENLLGLTNIIQQSHSYYTLNSVEVEPIKTADMDQCYHVITTNPEIESSWEASRLANPSLFPAVTPKAYTSHVAELPDFFKNYAEISYTQKSEAFVDTKIIDGVVTQVPASHTKTVSKSFESKAREAADAIMKSRKDQYSLAAGEQETPYTGEALQAMLGELKKWEDNYMSLFTGITIADTVVYEIYITPSNPEPEVAFYFNENKGLNTESGAAADAYQLKADLVYSTASFAHDNTPDGSGYRVRNAVPVKVTLLHNGTTLHDFGVVNMYQFGEIHSLNPSTKTAVDLSTIGFIF